MFYRTIIIFLFGVFFVGPATAADVVKDQAASELRKALENVRDYALVPVSEPTILASAANSVIKLPALAGERTPPEPLNPTRFLTWMAELQERYTGRVEDWQLVRAAVEGMVQMTGQSGGYEKFDSIARELAGGIGVKIVDANGVIVIISVRPGSAADGCLMAGDKILAVDDVITKGLSKYDVIRKLSGAPKSSVVVTYVRDDKPPKDVKLEREINEREHVEGSLLGTVAFLRISSFLKDTKDEIEEQLLRLRSQTSNLSGLVIDLRNNQGGLLSEVIGISDLFLDKGLIGSQQGRGKVNVEHYHASKGDVARGLPIIIVVNRYSANGTEFFASALQASGRAIVVGQPSAGEGYIRTIIALSSRSGMMLTTSQLIKMDGTPLAGHGIIPDIDLPNDMTDMELLRLAALRADRNAATTDRPSRPN